MGETFHPPSPPPASYPTDRDTESEVIEVPPPAAPPNLRQLVQTTLTSTRRALSDSRRRKILANLAQAASPHAHFNPHPPSTSTSSPRTPNTASLTDAASALDNLPKRIDVPLKPVPKLPPNGRAWIRVQTNMSLPEAYAHSFHVPYLGESDRQLRSSNSLAMDLLQNDLSENEDDSEVEDNVDISFLQGDEGEEADDDVTMEEPEGGEGKRDSGKERKVRRMRRRRFKHVEAIWDRAAKRVALRKVLDQIVEGEALSEALCDVVCDTFGFWNRKLVASYKRIIARRLAAVAEVDKDIRDKERGLDMVLRQARGGVVDSAAEVMKSESVKVFMCRQCYSFLCTLHGQFGQSRPCVPPLDASTKDMGSHIAEKVEADCEDRARRECWYLRAGGGDVKTWCQQLQERRNSWRDVELVVHELFETFGHDACRISAMLRVTMPAEHEGLRFSCRRVGYLLHQLFPEPDDGVSNRKRTAVQQKRRKGKWKSPRVPQEQDSDMPGRRLDYEPCHHEGPCTAKNCPCKQKGVLCEKFCGCFSPFIQDGKPQSFCPNMHRGCTCKKGSCQSKACVCFSMNRECDPDICRSCHECKDGSGESKNWCCQNNGLRMKRRQKVVAGHSEIHGWGVFATERIGKNDIIGEYVGEVISDDEAERRGRVYDEVTYSFLFTTTEQYALDSTHIGNKLRYCNHSLNPNCEPRVMRVGGDVRVGLYAKRDIEKHEELFFNYGYNENGPAWAMEGKPSKSKSKAGPSGKRKLDSDNDSNEMDVEILPVSNRRRRVVDVELESLDKSDEVPKVKKDQSEDEIEPRPDLDDVSPTPTASSPDRKRLRRERVDSNKRQDSRQQNGEKQKNGMDQPQRPATGQSQTVTKSPGSGRSVWRGFLRRVSVGAADVESPGRSGRMTNGHEDYELEVPTIKDERRTPRRSEGGASAERQQNASRRGSGSDADAARRASRDGLGKSRGTGKSSKHQNGRLSTGDSRAGKARSDGTGQATSKGADDVSISAKEANGIQKNSRHSAGKAQTPCNQPKKDRGAVSDETDSDSDEPRVADWYTDRKGAKQKAHLHGNGGMKKTETHRRRSAENMKQLSSNGGSRTKRLRDAEAGNVRKGNRGENAGKATEVICVDDDDAGSGDSKSNKARPSGSKNQLPNSGSGKGSSSAGTRPSKKQRTSLGKRVERDSSPIEAGEVVDLISVDGDESNQSSYEPNFQDWF